MVYGIATEQSLIVVLTNLLIELLSLFQTALHASAPSVWLPHSTFDHLQLALKAAPTDSTLAEVCWGVLITLSHSLCE